MNYLSIKRLIDLIVALFLIILFLPIWIIIPILIKLNSGGSIIYSHRRVGKGGKEFSLLKFRTMVENADEILFKRNKKLLEKFKQGDWKLKNDPRITKWGKWIRNLTIDEFPQLLNVLKGEMSIVGPRAYVKQEIDEQTKKHPETKKLIKKIAENYTLPYYTLTPTFSVCPIHGYLAGEHHWCPKCDKEIGYTEIDVSPYIDAKQEKLFEE